MIPHLETSGSTTAQTGGGHRIVAVASGKGGVGKTWFSITLSHALARAGQKTLLFDGDLGLANVDIQLGLTPRRDLGAVMTGQSTLGQVSAPFPEGGFDIIAGRSGTGSLANLSMQRLGALSQDLAQLARRYDCTVVDLGAGLERPVRMLAAVAGLTLVVTTDEPTALTDAYAFIKVTTQETPQARLGVVVNMATTRREGERTYETLLKACKGFLKIEPPLYGIIRRDARVREAIRYQTPLLARFPAADAAQDVEAVARKLIDE